MISTQFLQSCMAGDEEAIQTLVRTHQRGVFQLALSILDDGAADVLPYAGTPPRAEAAPELAGEGASPAVLEAEAATRETFIAAVDRLGRYREDTPFETWLYALTIQITRRRARRWKNRRWWGRLFGRVWGGIRRSSPAEPLSEPEASPYLQPADIQLWTAVRGLEEKLRIPVVLRYYHDFPIQDIARMLRVSEGAVHARLDQAREKIGKSIEKS